MNYPITIPDAIYRLLSSLLETGKLEQNGIALDFSSVQNIRINSGVMTFNPPPKLTVNVGPVKIRTTVSSMTAQGDGIKLEVDNSPVNIEIKPS
jgi:hypothetical protein